MFVHLPIDRFAHLSGVLLHPTPTQELLRNKQIKSRL